MTQQTSNLTSCEERALFGARRAEVNGCTFEGTDALMQCSELTLTDSTFAGPRPLCHLSDGLLRNVSLAGGASDALRCTKAITLRGCTIDAPRAVVRGQDVMIDSSRITSDGFGADCARITLSDSVLDGAEVLRGATGIKASNMELTATRALYGAQGGEIDFSTLSGADMLWEAKDITISDTVIDGDHLGWYSSGLTLTHCIISGARPFFRATNLTLIDCALDPSCSGAFERSEVEATIRGTAPMICNPLHGSITADTLGEVVFDDTAAPGTDCRVVEKKK